jgi:hypothetical protein
MRDDFESASYEPSDADGIQRPGFRDWLRAWREVMRDPDKRIPEPGIPGEGVPIPEHLDLHCPECGYNLTGLKEWRCPECGERFSPRRAYTLRMLRQPEYFLRYRYDPRELRMAFWALVLFVVGVIRATLAGPFGLFVGGAALAVLFGVIVLPNLILHRMQTGLSWPRFFFWMSLFWFVGSMILFS